MQSLPANYNGCNSRARVALVTGGAGFIGRVLCEHLLRAGWTVRVMGTASTENMPETFASSLEIKCCDICDSAVCHECCRDVDTVFHLAAAISPDPVRCREVNVEGTVNLLCAARNARVRRFVFSSSASVYGDTGRLPVHEDREIVPRSSYAASKAEAEQAVHAFHTSGLETVVLRYFNVFGAGQKTHAPSASVVPRFIEALKNQRPPIIHGDGLQTRDFVYVDDVARANLLASEKKAASGETLNIGSGRGVTVRYVLACLQSLMHADIAPVHVPLRKLDVSHSTANIRRAQAVLGFAPQVSLEEGLARMLADDQRAVPAICCIRS